MRLLGKVAWLIVLLGYVFPAYADTDQLCLRQCINSGQKRTGCMATCSFKGEVKPKYAPASSFHSGALNPKNIQDLQAHKIVNAPVVSKGLILEPKDREITPQVNHACLSQCLKGKKLYSFCERSCSPKVSR